MPVPPLGGAALLVAHALFKAALFLAVGIVDRAAGTRQEQELSGVGARHPALAGLAALAVASMVGLPPTLGFVAKEAVLDGFTEGGFADQVVLAGVVLGSALTTAYGLRFLWGAFARNPGRPRSQTGPVRFGFLAPMAVLAVAGAAGGLAAPAIDRVLLPYAGAYPGAASAYHLALWHGLTPALGLSVLALAAGGLLYYASRRGTRWRALRLPSAGEVYRRLLGWTDRLAVELTGSTQRGSLPFYLGVILVVLVGFAGGALLWERRGRCGCGPSTLRCSSRQAAQ